MTRQKFGVPKPSSPPPQPKRYSSITPKSFAEALAQKKAKEAKAKASGKQKPIARENKERQAKKATRYRAGMAAYRKSLTYKLVEQRAAGMCEYETTDVIGCHGIPIRCPNTRADYTLEHHHLTYARFGGDEIPEDVKVYCQPHHRLVEGSKPHKRGRFL